MIAGNVVLNNEVDVVGNGSVCGYDHNGGDGVTAMMDI